MAASAKIIIILVAISFVALALASEPEEGGDRQKRAILGPSKLKKLAAGSKAATPNCKPNKFANLKKCCKENVGNFFQLSAIQACSPSIKLDSKLISYSSYNLNTLFKKDNSLDLDDPKSINDIQTVACIVECLFKAQNLMAESGKINSTLAADFMAKAAPEKYKAAASPPTTEGPIMELISTGCVAEVDAMNLGSVTSKTGESCSKGPMMFIQCVRRTILAYCPPSLAINNDFCDKNVPMLKTCGVFNTTIAFNN